MPSFMGVRFHARVLAVGATLLAVGAAGTTLAEAGGHGSELARVRAATAPYHRLEVATHAGFAELADAAGLTCIEDPGGAGGMGVHYVNGALVGDKEIDATKPEVLIYEPGASGHKLIGVEYVVFLADWGVDRDPPELFGQEFSLVGPGNRYGLPPFYELHAWIWHHNPSGMLNDWNPRVDC
jgi:hypothetical protein